ncbi:CACTA en-spm transposon protein [Cucumis melo var. makuwa]|uniref:CACTA en-spm transposon protein n=1 Tax=Cucumis melo var. makuwa TaxID=1194695 RepID=A0A5A7SQB3_CUCMM|nr:CACTA en-spm transposon protein [Cucumis melo var. makuwa]
MCASFGSTRLMCASFGSTRLMCASFGSTRLMCASFGSTRLMCASFGSTRLMCASFGSTRLMCASFGSTRLMCASFGSTRLMCASFGSTRLMCASFGSTRLMCASFGSTRLMCASFGSTRLMCASFGSTRLMCASFGSTRLMCVSFGSTRLICASFGSTRLICASFGSTRLICAFYGTTRLLCTVRAQRGADRREAGRMREGHMDASGFLIASAMVLSEHARISSYRSDFLLTLLLVPRNTCDTTRKWSISDAEKDVGIKKVGNKGFPDAINTASGKHSFPTHHEGVGKYSSKKGTEIERGKERRSRESSLFPSAFRHCSVAIPRSCPSPLSLAAVYHFSYGSLFVLNIFIVDLRWLSCSYGSFFVLNLFMFGMAILQLCYGSLCSLEGFVGCEDILKYFVTINDFSAYGDLSGWSTKGCQACPIYIGVCVSKTFPVRCLKWADVGREYIEVIKGDLQRLFVLDFNDQAMNRFVEHQMFTTFKEFRANCYRHFKKYSDPEEARANPPNALVGRDED